MRKVLRFALTAAVLVVVGVLFGRALAENWAEVQEAELAFDPAMILGAVLFALAVPVSGVLWGGMVNRLAGTRVVGVRESIAVHSASWLLKYIPGQVGSFVNKVAWGARRGISRTIVAITFVYENVFLVLAATVPSVVILAWALGVDLVTDNVGVVVLPLLAVVPLLLISNRWVFHKLLAPVFRRIAKQDLPVDYFLSTPATIGFQTAFVVPRLLNGVGFVVTAATVAPFGPEAWLPLAAAYMLAGAAGLLAIFVPSGLGVREAVIVLFAAPYLGITGAIIASLLARLLSTLADVVVAGIYFTFRSSIPREETS